mmetsp:Transcript_9950/g.20292  ORF Transcript_9950/g.20292 Transcript_9950/m.20292 type:complete len:1018 (+) Transcript_9950:381-3434(+)
MAKTGTMPEQGDADHALGESFSSTNSTDREGHKKVKSFWPPSKHTDENGDTHEFSIPARIWLVLEDPAMGIAAKYMSFFMMILILASCVGMVLSSVPANREAADLSDCKESDVAEVDCDLCYDSHDAMPILDGKCSVCEGYYNATTSTSVAKVCEPSELQIFITVEAYCIYCFTLDYFLRIGTVSSVANNRWGGNPKISSCLSKVWSYSTGWLNLVDLVAILPFWIEVMVGAGVPLGFLRVLRLARVFRIFKLGKYNEGMSLFARTLHASIPALSLLCFFVLIGVVLFGSIIYFVEGGTYTVDATVCPEFLGYACYIRPNSYSGEDFEQSPFVSIPYSFYWVMVTMTTVGYGDQYPQTSLGKFITIICMLCGILTLALPITVLGSNFTAEYEALHGEGEVDKAAEEEKFWEHFASLVASSMSPESSSGEMPTIDSQSTRNRLKMMMMDNAGSALIETLSSSSSSSPVIPMHRRTSSATAAANSDAIVQLEQTILQLQRTLEALKGPEGMMVEEIDSGTSSPVSLQQQTKVSNHGASGAAGNLHNMHRVRRSKADVKPLVTRGEGHLPNYFDIFSPKKLKDKNKFDFAPIGREEGEEEGGNRKKNVEGNLKLSNIGDDIAEMERMVEEGSGMAAGADISASKLSLNLRRGSVSGSKIKKLKQVGKSLSFGQRFLKVKKYDQSIGAMSKRLEINIIEARGMSGEDCEGSEGLSFTVVAGATQFETKKSIGTEGGETLFGDKFEYDVPLSTHSGNMLVKNIEIIAHFGEKVVGVAVVPLTSVCGREKEFRLVTSNNSYLSSRNIQVASNIGYAGNGRVKVVLSWGKVDKEEHKFGTSFAMLLNEGAKVKGGGVDLSTASFRKPPVYPKVKSLTPKKRRQKVDLVVQDSGEAFFFEELSSGNSNSMSEVGKLVFPSTSSDEEDASRYTSPTESPGRSDTDQGIDSTENIERERQRKRDQERRRTQQKQQHYKAQMVEEFLHNKITPKSADRKKIRGGVGFGSFLSGGSGGGGSVKYEVGGV